MTKKNLIDIEFIKKYVDITEEELMMRLVKDAVGLQKEAEENELRQKVEARLADPTYRKYVRMFWSEYEYMSKYFTEDEIIAAAARFMSPYGLTSELVIPGHRDADAPMFCPAIFKRYGYSGFEEVRGSWTREVRKPATFYTVASNYQCGSSETSKYLLMNRLPYLNDCTKVELYRNFAHNDWIYIGFPEETEDGKVVAHSLYTPISALMNKDPQAIVNCHLNYWHSYGNGKYDAREKEFVNRDDVQAFLKKVAE